MRNDVPPWLNSAPSVPGAKLVCLAGLRRPRGAVDMGHYPTCSRVYYRPDAARFAEDGGSPTKSPA